MVARKKIQPLQKALKRINPLENEFNLWNLALLLVGNPYRQEEEAKRMPTTAVINTVIIYSEDNDR